MNEMVQYLLVVLGCFLGIALFIYVFFKISQLIVYRKSHNYRDMMEAQHTEGDVELRGEYILVTPVAPKPHVFGRSYKFNMQDHEKSKKTDDEKEEAAFNNPSQHIANDTEGTLLNDYEKTTAL